MITIDMMRIIEELQTMKKQTIISKGQVWTLDFIIGLLLFILVVILCTNILMSMDDKNNYETTYREAVYLSDTLLNQGYPSDWNSTTIIIPGLANNNRINISKLSEYSTIDYQRSKTLLHISGDYLFFFSNSTDILNYTQCTYGYAMNTSANCTFSIDSFQYEDLVKIDRIVILNSTMAKLTIYVWDG